MVAASEKWCSISFRDALERLLLRPWFCRLWVAQEVGVSNNITILCGHKHVPWSALTMLAMHQQCDSLTPPGSILSTGGSLHDSLGYLDRLDKLARLSRGNHRSTSARSTVKRDGTPFHTLMHVSQKQQCGAPVDRIWAVLGLLPEAFREQIKDAALIDYTFTGKREYWRSYAAVMRLLCNWRRERFWTAVISGMGLAKHSAMPSWCPDWNALRFYGEFSHGDRFRAGFLGLRESYNNNDPEIAMRPESSLLSARGFTIDTVRSITKINGGQPSSAHSTAQRDLEHWKWIHECFTLVDSVLGNSQHSTECFCHALLAADLTKRIDRSWHKALEMVSRAHDAWSRGEIAPVAEVPESFFSLTSDSRCRKVFVTVHGRVGLGPPDMSIGDRICVFKGAKPLLVLRVMPCEPHMENGQYLEGQSAKEEEQFSLVGEAYIYGLMEGQAFTAASRGSDRNFNIV